MEDLTQEIRTQLKKLDYVLITRGLSELLEKLKAKGDPDNLIEAVQKMLNNAQVLSKEGK